MKTGEAEAPRRGRWRWLVELKQRGLTIMLVQASKSDKQPVAADRELSIGVDEDVREVKWGR
jgi:hypothetical protein